MTSPRLRRTLRALATGVPIHGILMLGASNYPLANLDATGRRGLAQIGRGQDSSYRPDMLRSWRDVVCGPSAVLLASQP